MLFDGSKYTLFLKAVFNMEQLYSVLWQTLELEELEDADFHEFVLATLEELVLALGDPNLRVSELAGALLSEFEQAPS